jgi:NADH-quinone oxidoreductase subunit N
MSTPLIWIVFPFAVSIGLFFLRARRTLTTLLSAGISLLLAVVGLFLPFEGQLPLFRMGINISPTLQILGRQFVLDESSRYLLVFLFGMSAFWFLGTLALDTPAIFPVLGLGITAVLIGALAVEPFLYAALLVEVVVLLSIPMYLKRGSLAGPGLQRYLIFQTLGLPFILFAGWVLGGTAISAETESRLLQAALMLALGFAFWLAVFPFYTWVPLLSVESHPLVFGFGMTLLPMVGLLLAIDFLEGYAWLRSLPFLVPTLRAAGILMVFTGGAWAAFQDDLKRLFGYAVIIETGFGLIAISLLTKGGLDVFATSLLPRFLALAEWSLALSVLSKQGVPLNLGGIAGMARRFPFALTGLILASYSLSGLPLLAGFPVKQPLLELLAGESLPQLAWVFIGMAGFLAACLRVTAQAVRNTVPGWQASEDMIQRVMLIIGAAALFVIGLFPQLFLMNFLNLLGH